MTYNGWYGSEWSRHGWLGYRQEAPAVQRDVWTVRAADGSVRHYPSEEAALRTGQPVTHHPGRCVPRGFTIAVAYTGWVFASVPTEQDAREIIEALAPAVAGARNSADAASRVRRIVCDPGSGKRRSRDRGPKLHELWGRINAHFSAERAIKERDRAAVAAFRLPWEDK